MSRTGPTGQQFDYGQLEWLWTDAGGSRKEAPLMAAIAMAESGGQSDARNPSGATGLWQILGDPFPGNALDPYTNAKMAVAKYNSQGLGAWTTYTSGAYKQFFKKGVKPQDPGGIPSGEAVPYKNPLRGVQGLQPERVDMGVDYGGSGPLYALGPGVITNTTNSGWPGGAFISERITQGPLAGRYVYTAENITPDVTVGQHVTADTQIGTMTGGIETGFAEPPGTGYAAGRHQFTGNNPTAYGEAYNQILTKLGAPSGSLQGQKPSGTLPGWLNDILKSVSLGWDAAGGTVSSAAGDLGAIGSALGSIGQAITSFETAIQWLFVPSNWVRIICFFTGSTFIIIGVVTMSRTGRASSVSTPQISAGPLGNIGASNVPAPGGQLAPAIGIAEVTIGAILLFLAFHNLQAMGISNFQELLGYVTKRAHGNAPQAVA